MTKDRKNSWMLDDADKVRLVTERSSTTPVEYAFMLIVLCDGQWHTVRTFDNAHSPEEHHEHAYRGDDKQEPIVTHGPVNEAMAAVRRKIDAEWADIVSEWEQTRNHE